LLGATARGLLGVAFAARLVGPFVRRHVTLPVAHGSTLAGRIAAHLGVDEALFAAALGPPRPNLKPVVQVFDRSGRTVAYAKIGWNDLTRRLVRHEYDVLRSLRVTSPLVVPEPLGLIGDDDVVALVLSPLKLWHFRPRDADLPTAAMMRALIATNGDERRMQLSDSDYWRDLRSMASDDRIARRTLLERAVDEVERVLADQTIVFGGAHGDFAPWNVLRHRGRMTVWDWERFRPEVPLGLDLLHYANQRSTRGDIRLLPEAAAAGLPEARGRLIELGVAPRAIDPLVTLYYTDLLARYEADALGEADGSLPEVRAALDRAVVARLARGGAA
jgi:hypothetical protein